VGVGCVGSGVEVLEEGFEVWVEVELGFGSVVAHCTGIWPIVDCDCGDTEAFVVFGGLECCGIDVIADTCGEISVADIEGLGDAGIGGGS
jgi:hypothetical protein